MAANRVIGLANRIPWHLPEDFKWFKRMTTGHVVVMGRKTFESIGKLLPNRDTIVLSRSGFAHPGVRTIASLDELPSLTAGREVFICGGAELYRLALPQCSDLFMSHVHRTVEGGTFFPPFEDDFEQVEVVLEQPEFKVIHYRNRRLAHKS